MMRTNRYGRRFACGATTLMVVLVTTTACPAMGYRTVALTGDAAPGAAGAFDGFRTPQLSNSGQASFAATVQGMPGVWAESGAQLGLVALAGATNPGVGGGINFSFFDAPVVNDSGSAAFIGFLVGSGVNLNNNTGLWSNASGSLELLARAGGVAPGTGNNGPVTTTPLAIDNLRMVYTGTPDDPVADVTFEGGLSDGSGLSFTGPNGIPFPGGSPWVMTIRWSGLNLDNSGGANDYIDFELIAEATEDAFANTVDVKSQAGRWALADNRIEAVNEGLRFSVGSVSLSPGTLGSASFDGFPEYHAAQHRGSLAAGQTSTINVNGQPATFTSANSQGDTIAVDLSSSLPSSVTALLASIGAASDSPLFYRGDAMDLRFTYSDTSVPDNFAVLGSPVVNPQGRVAFFATLSGGDVVEGQDDNGVWAQNAAGDLQLVARAGDPAPGTPSGTVFALLNSRPALSDDGRVTFQSTLAGASITQSNASGIWSQDGAGDVQLVARAGAAAPGTSAQFNAIIDAPSVNGGGEAAFVGALSGAGVTSANNRGIWTNATGAVSLVAREGDAAPGAGAGVAFGDLENAIPTIGDNDAIVFRASLAGAGVTAANNASLWKSAMGGLSLVAREGQTAAGVADAAAFLRFEDDLVVNPLGQTAFVAALTGAGVTADNNLGIWAEDSSGVLRLVARTGELFDVDDSPGLDERTLTDLSLLSPSSSLGGSAASFAATGQLAFYAAFADSSNGVFVVDVDSLATLAGDYNGDGMVDVADYTVWRDNYGTAGPAGDGTGPGLDGAPDGVVDVNDYLFWRANFGQSAGAIRSNASHIERVPEPTAAVVTCMAIAWATTILAPRLP